MRKLENLLIVLADGEHARYVRPTPENVLHTAQSFDSASAHKRASGLVSDRPGASYHSDSSAHHAMTPRHDPHQLEKEHFSRFVAEDVNAMQAPGFSELMIAAPSHSLAAIMEHLAPQARNKLVGTIAKDLMKVPDDELWPHFAEFVPPARPARRA